MNNFKIYDNITDKDYWVSRSLATMTAIFAKDEFGELCVLINKRGSGTPNFQGCWNMPGGFIDYNETIWMSAAREVEEETGLIIEPSKFNFIGIHSDPSMSEEQNITIKFWVHLPRTAEYYKRMLTARNSEKNEVSAIKFMRVTDILSITKADDFAFNHYSLIANLYNTFYYEPGAWKRRLLCRMFNKVFMTIK